MQLQKMTTASESGSSAAAAQAAASQADALLDSIQMPRLHSTSLSAVIVDASSSSSEGSGDDESDAEQGVKAKNGSPNMGMESVSS
jgi:hypothetical protein